MMCGYVLLMLTAVSGSHAWLAYPSCDIAEVNYCYDGEELRFIQLLAANWHAADSAVHYDGWKIISHWEKTPYGVVGWCDNDPARWHLRAAIVRETWTDFDPEHADRKLFPCNLRCDPWGSGSVHPR